MTAMNNCKTWRTVSPTGDFNGMDCSDIIVGMARGDLGRVVDSYTRDRLDRTDWRTPALGTGWIGNASGSFN
jgi:hypothetical protein